MMAVKHANTPINTKNVVEMARPIGNVPVVT
jgi:hypothetical protein